MINKDALKKLVAEIESNYTTYRDSEQRLENMLENVNEEELREVLDFLGSGNGCSMVRMEFVAKNFEYEEVE